MPAAARARARMVDALRSAGRVPTPAVEAAFRTVPRHLFLPGLPVAAAYADEAVAVQFVDGVATSSASQPSMMAIMLEQLGLRPGHRVLEIGAGTGYNAALISRIVGPTGSVTAVDIDTELVASAAGHLAAAEAAGVPLPGIALHCADGALGHPPSAPYDRIVLTVGSSDVRPEWVEQLAPGGRLLLPLTVRGSQLSMALDLGADGLLRTASVRSCMFIRLRGIGTGVTSTVGLPGGEVLELPDDGPGVDPPAVAEVLTRPGVPIPTPVSLGPADVWDGLGLWLMLTQSGAFRLRAPDGGPALSPGFPGAVPLGSTGATIGLVATPSGAPPGLAVLGPSTAQEYPGHRQPVAALPYGPAGRALAARLLRVTGEWVGAGAPVASRWRFTVVPGPVAGPVTDVRVVRKEHCHLIAELADPSP